jgi:hypothetical protein
MTKGADKAMLIKTLVCPFYEFFLLAKGFILALSPNVGAVDIMLKVFPS